MTNTTKQADDRRHLDTSKPSADRRYSVTITPADAGNGGMQSGGFASLAAAIVEAHQNACYYVAEDGAGWEAATIRIAEYCRPCGGTGRTMSRRRGGRRCEACAGKGEPRTLVEYEFTRDHLRFGRPELATS